MTKTNYQSEAILMLHKKYIFAVLFLLFSYPVKTIDTPIHPLLPTITFRDVINWSNALAPSEILKIPLKIFKEDFGDFKLKRKLITGLTYAPAHPSRMIILTFLKDHAASITFWENLQRVYAVFYPDRDVDWVAVHEKYNARRIFLSEPISPNFELTYFDVIDFLNEKFGCKVNCAAPTLDDLRENLISSLNVLLCSAGIKKNVSRLRAWIQNPLRADGTQAALKIMQYLKDL